MHRNIILDFLSSKHLELAACGYQQMTICQFGRVFPPSYLSLITKNDNVNVYHIKEPRIYQKEYSLETLTSTIIDMMFESKEMLILNYHDFSFTINDPFYLKDIRNLSFESLQIVPIIEEELLIGVIIIYYDKKNVKVEWKNNELVKLLNNLTSDECQMLENQIMNEINSKNAYAVMASNSETVYLNEPGRLAFKLAQNYYNLKTNNSEISKIKRFMKHPLVKTFKYNNLNVYYIKISNLAKKDIKDDVYLINSINNHQFGDTFGYGLLEWNQCDQDFIDQAIETNTFLGKLLEHATIKIYQYSQSTLVFLVDQHLSNEEINRIKTFAKDDYLIITNSSTKLNNKMDLIKLSQYFYELHPEKFNYVDYLTWIDQNHTQKLLYDYEYQASLHKMDVINSLTNESICPLLLLPPQGKLRKPLELEFIKASEKLLEVSLNRNDQTIMLPLLSSSLNKRKTLEVVKKYLENNKNLKVIVHFMDDSDPEECAKAIVKMKKLGLYLIADSSIYFNFEVTYLTTLFDAVYISKKEFAQLDKYPDGLNSAILNYVINDYKDLFFEVFDQEVSELYQHSQFYYIKWK